MTRRQKTFIAILALALVLRLGALYYFANVLNVEPLALSTDAIMYHVLARALLYDHDWSHGNFVARPPLYPLLMAGLYAIFGGNRIVVAVANAVFGAVTAALAYLLAGRLAEDRLRRAPRPELGTKAQSRRRVAVLAGVLVAVDPASIVNNINLQAETLSNFFLVLMLLSLERVVRKRQMSDAAWAGLWLGLATLARPTTLFLFLFALPIFLILMPRQWRLYLPFAVVPLAFILIWCARNYAYTRMFTFTTVSDFNMLFYRAVSIERRVTGESAHVIQRRFAYEIERRLGTGVMEEEIDSDHLWKNITPQEPERVRVMRQIALEVFLAHPVWYFAVIPIGLYHMFGYSANLGAPSVLELVYNAAFYALAAWGVVMCRKRRPPTLLVLLLTLIGYVVLATMASQTTGMDTRMRTPITVPLAILAAEGAVALWRYFTAVQ